MKKYLILFGAVVSLGSCKKFLDVNKNPNTPEATSAPAANVFTAALNATSGYVVGGSTSLGATWTGQWAHSTSFTGGGEEKTYAFNNTNFNNFDGAYDILFDYQNVINNADAQNVSFLKGPAKVMQCLIFQKLVDMYGDIPYSEALQGTDFFTPAYDNQQTVYEDLITKLTEAITEIKASSYPQAFPADIMFGDPTVSGADIKGNWVRFANTLKMRILMRQVFMTGRLAYIQTEVSKIVAEPAGLLTSTYATVWPGYLKQLGKMNLFYTNYGYTDQDQEGGTFRFRKMNAVIIDWMKSSSDAFRLQRLATPKVGGTPGNLADYVGIPLGGGGNAYLETLVSSIGSSQVLRGDATRRMIIMSPAEAYFLIAEAQAAGVTGLTGTAQSNYENGVRWAFRLAAAAHTGTGTTNPGTPSATNSQADAAANTYLASGTLFADWSAATNATERHRTILIQKWMALTHVDGLESWSEYRKASGNAGFGFVLPNTPKSVAAGTNPEPRRLFYPLREFQVNGSNVPTGVDVFTTKIFWDIN
jgi:hypothetical protein